ncbi:MAG: EFR1 family ferrodoxin [Bacteroidales bacterium]|nr:EFR1 family ferrodoxin [Bacteroidales bacterium]
MIICFSGTGNTRRVAQVLASKIGGEPIVTLDHRTPTTLTLQAGERVVWMFPVHSWGIPRYVRQYMRKVNLVNPDGKALEGVKSFMVATCGDDVGKLHRQWRSEMRRRGWKPIGAFSVEMPNTYVFLPGFHLDSALLAQGKLAAMPERVEAVARAIRHDARVDDVVRGRFAWLKTRVVYPLFMRFLTSAKPFKTTEGCNGCGRCVRACPLANIRLDQNKRPQWGPQCTLCTGCYHACVHVEYGRYREKQAQG